MYNSTIFTIRKVTKRNGSYVIIKQIQTNVICFLDYKFIQIYFFLEKHVLKCYYKSLCSFNLILL